MKPESTPRKLFLLFSLTSLLFWSGSFLVSAKATPALTTLSQEELIHLTKPAIVRIVQEFKGTMTVPPFKVNFQDFSITPDPRGKIKTLPLEETIAGSGFIIHPDGYILTNAHVVSYQTVKLSAASEIGRTAILDAAFEMSDAESEALSQDKEKIENFTEKILDYLLANIKFDFQKKVTVLNPRSSGENIKQLVTDGFPARLVSVNDNFFKDDRDVAVIKIDQTNLPAMQLGNSVEAKIGDSISIFGFPTTAELNEKNLLEASFTQGIISALKDSEKKDFKLFQTDAKISRGSSGGPLFNDQGEALGVITYQTTASDQTQGDNFAFAIPLVTGQEIINSSKITDDSLAFSSGSYTEHFKNGLNFLHARKCQKALAEFAAAKEGINENFIGTAVIDPYIQRCEQLISSGQSVDTSWDEFREKLRGIKLGTWILSGIGLLILSALITVIIMLTRRIKKDETELNVLEKEVDKIEHPQKNAPSEIQPEKSVAKQPFKPSVEPGSISFFEDKK